MTEMTKDKKELQKLGFEDKWLLKIDDARAAKVLAEMKRRQREKQKKESEEQPE